jgi:hypothetical protein
VSRRRPAAATLVVVALMALFVARLTHTALEKSYTYDEPHYIGTGLYLWHTGDYQWVEVLSGHPPLAFHLASLPWLFADAGAVPLKPNVGFELIERPEPELRRLRLLTRAPFIALACWGALLLFFWARETAGAWAGVAAVFLYTFCPTILANAPLAHSDITVTVMFLQTLYAFWRWCVRPRPLRLILASVSLGLALLAKLSAILLVPTLGALALARAAGVPPPGTAAPRDRRFGGRIAWAAVVLLVLLGGATAVVWLGFGGSFATRAAAGEPYADVPLPGYLRALLFDVKANSGGRRTYLFGDFSAHGWWYFFPLAVAVKTPLAALALLGLAVLRRRPERRSRSRGDAAARADGPAASSLSPRRLQDDGGGSSMSPPAPHGASPGGSDARAEDVGKYPRLGAVPAVAAAVYALVACFVLKVPLGVRYILPLYPIAHLFVATRLAPPPRGWRRLAIGGAAAWLALASLAAHPHYLAYFNEAVGGPAAGPRYLIESNIDWGQDLSTLASYLRTRGNPPVQLAYFGRESPASYGMRATRLADCAPVTGVVAVSVNYLTGLYAPRIFAPPDPACWDWLRGHEPVARPGYSIVVYDIPAAGGS